MSEIPEMPGDPFLNPDVMPMAQSARDIFLAGCAVGFTEDQAMQFAVGVVVTVMMKSA